MVGSSTHHYLHFTEKTRDMWCFSGFRVLGFHVIFSLTTEPPPPSRHTHKKDVCRCTTTVGRTRGLARSFSVFACLTCGRTIFYLSFFETNFVIYLEYPHRICTATFTTRAVCGAITIKITKDKIFIEQVSAIINSDDRPTREGR